MLYSKIVILFLALLLIQTSAHISIQIDPDDFDQVSDFFENIIINRQYHPVENIDERIHLHL